ncbi:MAG TPA: SGNH/GDSL hydrolase family protein [Chitinophagaceae bacterium]|nr:SGNH/GDSL hydrolase family protein [Chitinophagaceae bacterium]
MKRPELTGTSSSRGYTYLALGDSYTIGELVKPEDNFPNQVVRLLHEKGIEVNPPRIVAKTGWTTDELQAAMENASLKKSYDFVTLLIGVNNQYRGLKVVDYIPQFESLLKQAISYAGNDTAHVAVLSIPDWGATPFAYGRDRKLIASEIEEYNAAAKLVAEKYHIYFVDITTNSKQALEDHSLVTSDGLHPSPKEYSRWAEQAVAYFQKHL